VHDLFILVVKMTEWWDHTMKINI